MIHFTTAAELRQAKPPESPCRMSPRQFERRVVALAHALREVCMEVEMPVIHRFAPGIYIREIFMPANSVVIGNLHHTEHFNLVLTGACHVLINGETHDLHAGDTMVSKAGARKMLLIHEDCRWQTIHANPDDCQDIEALDLLPLHVPLAGEPEHLGEVRHGGFATIALPVGVSGEADCSIKCEVRRIRSERLWVERQLVL